MNPIDEPWAQELERSFAGWLLPHAERQALSPAVAARFLERLTGRPDHLDMLRASSLFLKQGSELDAFTTTLLPGLVRVLPARTRVERRTWEGGFVGRLDVRATWELQQQGQSTHFVTRSRRRDFALPENILARAAAAWLLRELERLTSALSERGWLESLAANAGRLRKLLQGSVLREVPVERITAHHLQAAETAAHPAYRAAACWYRALLDAFSDDDPQRTAALLARGALQPASRAKRFELAVLVRLIRALSEHLQATREGSPWRLEHAVIVSGRKEIVVFHGPQQARIRLYFDLSPLPDGFRRGALDHYFGAGARPDISLCREHPDGRTRWAVIEIKCSPERNYLVSGFDEALAYRSEYAEHLGGWPEAVLVCSEPILGDVRPEDPVVAVDWRRWPPPEVVAGLVDGLDQLEGPTRQDVQVLDPEPVA